MPDPDWMDARRVVYYDPRYHTSWVALPEAEAIAFTLEEEGGFRILGAKDLRTWMSARVPGDAASTVCVMAQDAAPDTVFETPTPECLIRRYMDSGGRVVWGGDLPFVFQGSWWGKKRPVWASHAVLGIDFEREPREGPWELATSEGLAWGLNKDRGESRTYCPKADQVTALSRWGEHAPTFLLNFNPRYPLSGFVKLGGGGISATGASMEELLALATHGLGEARPGHWLLAGEPQPASAPPAEGTFVESGTFRVDRSRALEKLMKFQLPDEDMFVLPWVRCAAAAQAGRAEFRFIRRGLELSFEEASFPPEALSDPFEALFGGAPKEAARQLALGIVAALRTGPEVVEVVSGGRTLRVRGVSDFSLSASGPQAGTRIRALWSNLLIGRFHAMRAKSHVSTKCKACAPWLKGVSSPEMDGFFQSCEFDEDGVRGRISIPPPVSFASQLDVYHLGVLAGSVAAWTWPAQVCGWIDAKRVGVDMSGTRVVRDRRLDEALLQLRGPMRKLAQMAIPDFSRLMPEAAKLMIEPRMRRLWSQVIEHPCQPAKKRALVRPHLARASILGPLGFSGRVRAVETVVRAAWMAGWLRMSTGCIPEETPLYFTADCGCMSLARLRDLSGRLGRIPYVTEPQPGRPGAGELLLFLQLGDYRNLQPDWKLEQV